MATQIEIVEGQKSGSTAKYYFEPDFPSGVAPRSQMASEVNVSATKYAKSVGIRGGVGGSLKRRISSFPDRQSCSFGLYYKNASTRQGVYCTDFTGDTTSTGYLTTGTVANMYFLAVPATNYNFWRFEYADGTAVTKSSAVQAASNVYMVVTPDASSTLGGRKYGELMFGYNCKRDDEIFAVFSHTLRLMFIDDTGRDVFTLCKDDLSAARQAYVAAETKLSYFTSASPRQSGTDINYLPQIGTYSPGGRKLVGYKVKKYYSYTPDIIASDALATITDADATIADIDDALTEAGVAFERDVTSKGIDDWGYYRDVVLEGIYDAQMNVTVRASGASGEQSEPSVSASPSVAFAGATVTLTAQTDDLATCEFGSWSSTYVDGQGTTQTITVTPSSTPGVATFTMPDADVSCVAAYVAKKFSVSVGNDGNGSASVSCRASDSGEWGQIPQGGVEYGYQVRFLATHDEGYVFDGWYRPNEESPYSMLEEFVVGSISEQLELIAKFRYGDAPQAATVTVVASGAGTGMVDIIGGSGHEASDDGSVASAEFGLNDDVTLEATFTAEYVFVGWFAGNTKISESPVHSFKFGEDSGHSLTRYTAVFGVSDDAIYEWEGSEENKEVEWTSKVYVAPRPFDPVAARVDAAGYPVDLTVRTYSSPDVEDRLPPRDHELVQPTPVQSQNGRRLPRMRPERYVRFTVKSTHEIDAVVVGTNMTEVN